MKRRRLLFLLVITAAVLWPAANAGYAWIFRARMEAWEETVERNEGGVRQGCEAFSVGEGDVALLMIHGFADSPAVYRGLAGALAAKGFACRAIRLPGFATEFETYARTNRSKWGRHVRACMEEEQRDHEAVWVVAHSLGAAVTLNLLAEEPALCHGLVLFNPLVEISERRAPLFSAESWFRVSEFLLPWVEVVENLYPMDVRGEVPAWYPGRETFVPRSVHRELFALVRANRALSLRIPQPMQLWLSLEDRVADPSAARQRLEAAAEGTLEVHERRGVGHVLMLEPAARDIPGEIADFVRSNASPSR